MFYRILVDLIVALHLGFVMFAVLGGVLALRWRAAILIHVPAVLWAAAVELAGWTCPLTPLENWLREKGELAGYGSGFIEHYGLRLLYPAALTREIQILLGSFVLAINVAIYAVIAFHIVRRMPRRSSC